MERPNFVLIVPEPIQPVRPPTDDEWFAIAKKMHPQMQREEFNKLWEQFNRTFKPETQQS